MASVKNMYRKSLLFEIVNRKNPNQPIEAFTLVIPPENIEIDEPQRISRTKTFGGVFEDDYGPDQIKITISGNTGNTDLKKTYAPPNATNVLKDKMDGKTAFYYFRNRIMRYKELKSLGGKYADYDMMIYDLSTVPDTFVPNVGVVTLTGLAEGFVVSLDNFKLKKNKEKPLFYNYEIEVTVLRKLGDSPQEQEPPVTVPNPMSLMVSIRRALNTLNTYFSGVDNFANRVTSVMDLTGQIEEQLVSYYDRTLDIITYPASLCKMAVVACNNLMEDIDGLTENVKNDLNMIEEEYLGVLEVGRELQGTINTLFVKSKEPAPSDSYINRMSSIPYNAKSNAERFSTQELDIPELIIAEDVDSQEAYEVYGHILITVTSETRLDKIALEHYGDSSLQELIASYNEIEDVDDLIIGTTLKVPVIEPIQINSNYIYSSMLSDVYGSDILIDEDGSAIVGENGDFITVSGEKNIIQALNLRLSESLGRRIVLTLYGLKASVGFASTLSTPVPYLLANIKDTVMQDPRIEDVENIVLKGVGDRLYISFDSYTIKMGEEILFEGSI